MKTARMMKPVQFAIATTVALTLSAPLYADPEGGPTNSDDPVFRKLDTNHDDYVSRGEAAKLRGFGNAFTEADDNHDGRLDRDEFLKAQAIYDRMRAKAYLRDSVITARVKAALVKDPGVRALEVSVKTDHGIVLLSGFVDNEGQAQRAQELATAVPGVKSVKSSLIVKS